ncbi:hypothetical protein HMPREF1254_0300 [Prevotella sp. BV3P1]|nr:hypothetical protein HMPREF1254_0300 [Prevotella sp. BV3P1]
MDEVVNANETLLVQRPEDKSVVILSMEEYNRLKAIEWRQQSNEPHYSTQQQQINE